jgi:hypothetical protein
MPAEPGLRETLRIVIIDGRPARVGIFQPACGRFVFLVI